ncbi:hypothetical protein P7K49_033068 [Saguinus oedipus]|uniref:AF-9 ANC1 homology domain-containing protein n=1 Tax=Saguinus oedipus TaxID=9490 RepID=A0ABQ9TQV7_SAGOE|nr:hypothetical protein P7K49_033068 [Saguinus oedipus]
MVEDLQSEESDEDDSSSGEEAAAKTHPGRDSRQSRSSGSLLESRQWKVQAGDPNRDLASKHEEGCGIPRDRTWQRAPASFADIQGGFCLRQEPLSFSDSESDNSADSCLPSREPPPPQKPPPPNSKVSGRRSPESCSKPEKILKKGTYDKVGGLGGGRWWEVQPVEDPRAPDTPQLDYPWVGAALPPLLALQASGLPWGGCGYLCPVLGWTGSWVGMGTGAGRAQGPPRAAETRTPPQAYTDELVELHRRLMALRERNVLQQAGQGWDTQESCGLQGPLVLHQEPHSRLGEQGNPALGLLPLKPPATALQIVNLIEETGHFNVTNTTFDFDLFSLDETTVRKLQSYLEAVAT